MMIRDEGNGSGINRYAVIFDAGSFGSRVHVFCFDQNLDPVSIGNDLELFEQQKPGLSFYASNPKEAANSLVSLLKKAENAVPKELHGKIPVRVGATAGLRQLEGDAPARILQAVRDLLKDESDLKSDPNWVAVLDGTQEGPFQWVTINYLLGKLGKKFSNTVRVVDLGSGSIQMAYAISNTDAAKAPNASDEEEAYVRVMYLKGRKYYLYIHSYLHYGLLAARAEIFRTVGDSRNPCILAGYQGFLARWSHIIEHSFLGAYWWLLMMLNGHILVEHIPSGLLFICFAGLIVVFHTWIPFVLTKRE